ncbi:MULTISPECIES: hypothetical protein [Halocynthiibacter]|uniref:Cytochrome C oxidase assembly protein n=1 Tax=Halocynthiibacter halioticoli TaxID=2986804 RepID=A0AAE3LS18_9RHOB|nr:MULTISPECIES: hypothetical protein [Halocynthiibacter]MCV6825253.1 hypothetical protein [Halocynthiibacter halioticoli]MCW4058254.1 hypothetical protein [Halocynthiibacter sp. SDUM655004]MDE0588725.1 hypothetical protein [Halocynthiibacter sp. C4]
MAPKVEHEMHYRRLGRNVGLGLSLFAFVAIVFWLTLAKVQRGEPVEAFDHTARPSLETQDSGN